MSYLEKVLNQENLDRADGEQGVKNFAKLCRLLGYKDYLELGQLDNGF